MRSAWLTIDEAVKEGLATLEKVEIRFYRSGKAQQTENRDDNDRRA